MPCSRHAETAHANVTLDPGERCPTEVKLGDDSPSFTLELTGPTIPVFTSSHGEAAVTRAYETVMDAWPIDHEELRSPPASEIPMSLPAGHTMVLRWFSSTPCSQPRLPGIATSKR